MTKLIREITLLQPKPAPQPFPEPSVMFPRIGARACFFDGAGRFGPHWARVYGVLSNVNASYVTVQLADGRTETLPRMQVFEPEGNEQ